MRSLDSLLITLLSMSSYLALYQVNAQAVQRLPEACFRKGFWQAVYAAQLRLSKSEIYEVHLRSPPTWYINVLYQGCLCILYTNLHVCSFQGTFMTDILSVIRNLKYF